MSLINLFKIWLWIQIKKKSKKKSFGLEFKSKKRPSETFFLIRIENFENIRIRIEIVY